MNDDHMPSADVVTRLLRAAWRLQITVLPGTDEVGSGEIVV